MKSCFDIVNERASFPFKTIDEFKKFIVDVLNLNKPSLNSRFSVDEILEHPLNKKIFGDFKISDDRNLYYIKDGIKPIQIEYCKNRETQYNLFIGKSSSSSIDIVFIKDKILSVKEREVYELTFYNGLKLPTHVIEIKENYKIKTINSGITIYTAKPNKKYIPLIIEDLKKYTHYDECGNELHECYK